MDVIERDERIRNTSRRMRDERRAICAAVTAMLLILGAQAQEDEHEALILQIKDHIKQGRYGEAVPIAEKLLADNEQALGPEHSKVAAACNALAEALRLSGRYGEARPYYERNLAIRRKVSGPESEEAASAINNLGALHYDEGDYAGAESRYRAALVIREARFGPEHLKVASSLNNIGNAVSSQGRLIEAEPFYRRALAIREKALDPNDLAIANAYGNLAVLLTELGRYEEAERCYARSIEIVENALGATHPDLASAINNLANLYFRQEKLAEAEPLYLRALAIREKALGPDHAQTGMCMNNLGLLYYVMGRFADAENYLQRSLAIHERALGPEHPDVAESLNSLAVLRFDQGRYDEVAQLYERSLAIREKAFGSEHPSVAMSLANIANLENLFGRSERAARLHRRSLAIAEKALGGNHPSVATSLVDLGAVLVDMDRLDEAEGLYQRAAAVAVKSLGSDCSQHADVLMKLGELELKRLHFDEAEKYLARSLGVFERLLGEHHRFVGKCLRLLAVAHHEMGRDDRAADALDRALENFRYRLAHQFTYMSETDRLAYLDAAEDLFSVYFTHYLSPRTPDPKAAEKLYDLVLWRKGLVAQSVAALRRRVVRSADPEALSLFNSLVERKARLARLATAMDEDEKSPRERIQKLTQETNELEQRLVRRVPGTGGGLQESSWRDVAHALRADEAAVEIARYKVHDQRGRQDEIRYIAMALSPGGSRAPTLVELGDAAPIDSAVFKTHATVLRAGQSRRLDHDEPTDGAFGDAERRLAEMIWRPIEAALGSARRVYISPDGLLSRVNFAALPAEQDQRVLDKREVRLISSTRDLARSPDSYASRSATLIGDPRFDLPADAQRIAMRAAADSSGTAAQKLSHWRSVDLRGAAVKELPHTGVEIGAIRERLESGGWHVDALTGAAATEEAVKRVQGPRVLHVATHGFFLEDRRDDSGSRDEEPWSRRENPMLRAGLLFTGAERSLAHGSAPEDLEDGVLTAYEAANLDLDGTELVILSACDTGLGDVKNGEGVLGLRRALHVAGADAVLMSLWAVPDRETQELMTLFYDNWLAGKEKQEALREAQLAMRETVKRRYGSDLPFYWAAFVIEGR